MSASVIDALIVTLGLDGSGFKKGIKEADDARKKAAQNEAKLDKEREQATKKAVDGYRSIRNELLAVAGIFTAGVGIKNFITDTINSAANLGYLSQNLRMSTQDLTSWQRASERAGGSAGGIIAQLKESADTLAQLKSGFGPNEGLQNFFRFGGNADDLKDGNTYLLARSRIIADLFKQDPSKAALVAKQMGISDDQFNFLKQGPAAVTAMVQAQEKNAVVTERDARAAQELRNKVLDLRDSLQSTATRILLDFAPSLERVFSRLESLSQWVAEHRDDISRWITTIVKDVKEFAQWADRAAESLGGWQNVLIGLAAIKAASMAVGFVQLAASLLQVGAALGGVSAAGAAVGLLGKLGLVGAAGAAGYGVGTLISKNLPDSINDKIGEFVARTLASFGNKEAADAIRINTGKDDYGAGTSVAPKGAAKSGNNLPRGLRNNNPGNIIDSPFTRSHGATGSDGRFAQFATAQAGMDALAALLRSYGARGFDTVSSIINRYAPRGENNTAAYIADVAQRMGVRADAKLNIGDPQVLQSLMGAIVAHENGGRAAKMANARAVGAMPVAAAAGASAGGAGTAASQVTSTTYVDTINVNTAATDAPGIARSIGPAVQRYSFATQANSGMR